MILISSCASKNVTRYTVASEYGDCVGVAPQKCLLVKKQNQTDWEFFYSSIQGFNYQEGNEYVIDVSEEKIQNVPADASSIMYKLVKEVSRTAKISEGLPEKKLESYQLTGRVISVESQNIGQGAAAGKIPAVVVKVQVSTSVNKDINPGDIIYCELIKSPRVNPVAGREYVFKAKYKHPAHAKGIYLLETDVMDLVV